MWKASWGQSHWETHDNPTTSKITLMISRSLYLLRNRTLLISQEETRLPHFKDFLKYKCDLHLKPPLPPPHCKIIVANCTWKHRLGVKTGWLSTIPISRDNRLCHFCSYNTVEMRHTLCWSVPYITPLEISFHHYLRLQYQGASSLSFNWIIKLTLTSISWRLLYSATLENQLI